MIAVVKHANAVDLALTDQKRRRLGGYLMQEITEAIAARAAMEELWRELLRQYEAVPKKEVRDVPIINAPNIEVTVGAQATDEVYAQIIDQILNADPLVTVRATNEAWVEHAKRLQKFINWVATNESNIHTASAHGLLDCTQLGTGGFYIPFVENRKKTKTEKSLFSCPTIEAVPIEDLLVPGGSVNDPQRTRWIGKRSYMTEALLKIYAKQRGWDISSAKPCGPISWVRARREQLGKTITNADKSMMRLYEIWEIYIAYDIDGDGFDEELLVIWDRTSSMPLKVVYNPYDVRPFEVAQYQIRGHLFYATGVMEMCRPFGEGATEVLCQFLANCLLANSRVWAAREGVIASTEDIFPSKVFPLPDPEHDLKAIAMADVYPSIINAMGILTTMAQQRVGVNAMSSSHPQQLSSSRTPGITALSMLQQINRRFTPAFNNMHGALSRAIKQCLWRYRERVLMGDRPTQAKIVKIMGMADGEMVLQLLRNEDFNENIEVELTASSQSVNREQDRQSLVILGTQILGPYYQQMIQLVMLASNPQLPQPVRDVLAKVAKATGEGIDTILRTFDQVRDPERLAVTVVAEIEALSQTANMQQQMVQIAQMLGGQGGAGGPMPPMPMGEIPPPAPTPNAAQGQ